jgi:thiamine pyrophosphokinase
MATSPKRAIVLAGGDFNTAPFVEIGDFVIAADSGYDHAVALDVQVDLLVGDLDSISTAGLAHAKRAGVAIEQHPTDKDHTDLELALAAAVDRDAIVIDIHGAEGGRIGHLLSVALLTAAPDFASTDLTWHTGTGTIRAATVGRAAEFAVDIGDTVTLVPVGDASGIATTGLRWPLNDAVLITGTSRGVSNEAISDHVIVEVRAGSVLVIHEGPVPS